MGLDNKIHTKHRKIKVRNNPKPFKLHMYAIKNNVKLCYVKETNLPVS